MCIVQILGSFVSGYHIHWWNKTLWPATCSKNDSYSLITTAQARDSVIVSGKPALSTLFWCVNTKKKDLSDFDKSQIFMVNRIGQIISENGLWGTCVHL